MRPLPTQRLVAGILATALWAASGAVHAQVNRWEAIGQMWISGGFPPVNVYQLAFGAEGTLLAANSFGLFESPGDGTWKAVVQTPWFDGFPYMAYDSILVEPGSPGSLLAGLSLGGVNRSTDGGATWFSGFGGSGFRSMAESPSSPRVVFANVQVLPSFATSRSSDFGATWTPLPALDGTPVQALAVDAASSDVVYAAASPSSAGLPTGVYRSSDAGQTWSRLGGGLPDDVYKVLTADPVVPGTVYAGSDASGVLRSDDGGQSWAPVNQGLGSPSIRQIVVDPTAPSRVFAGTTKGVYRSEDRGGHWSSVGFHEETTTSLTLDAASGTLYAGLVAELARIRLAPPAPCAPGPQTLCLDGRRFQVEAVWRGTVLGSGGVSPSAQGVGQAAAITDDTGAFWFFDAANLELVVKVLDGRGINGDFWVFYGALTNLEFILTITDTQTGAIQSYYEVGGRYCPPHAPCPLASLADTGAFPGAAAAASATPAPSPARVAPATAGPCVPDGRTLCQLGGRFQVRVDWQDSPSSPTSPASAVALTDDTGYFWFFDASNVELVVKTLDGTAVNGHYWVFSGALSDLPYTITVTDLATGAVRTYANPSGQLQGFADTNAF